MVGSRQSLFPQKSSCRTRRTAGSRKMLGEDIGMNSDVQRNLMTFIASSFFAGLCVCTASSKSPREIANDKRTTFNAEISNAVSRDMISKVPAEDDLKPSKQEHPSYLADYAYAEVPPGEKPADTVLDSLKDIPIGTPIEEIKRASDAFGLDFSFMKAVAKIESDFDPKQRTGSYIGLFQ